MEHKIPNDVLKKIFPKRLERRDLNGKVYNILKNMILSGKLKNGQRLIQEKLAHSLNVSRRPVHVALVQLEKDKLIIRKGKEGAFVL
jgi:DNA-binding GntR family transcriptional regulator